MKNREILILAIGMLSSINNMPSTVYHIRQDLLKKLSDQKSLSAMEQQQPKQCYNLMLLLDPYIEKEDNEDRFQIANLRQALWERSFPILVSSNIVKLLLLAKKGEKILYKGIEIFDKAIINKIYPTDKDWDCYSHKTKPFFLLIPKSYIAQFSQSLNAIQQMKDCGFDNINLHKFDDLLPDTLLSYIDEQDREYSYTYLRYDMQARDISQFFSFNIEDITSWNIYLAGHGHILWSRTDAPLLAGLSEKEFLNLMKVFQKIKTSFVHCSSCYSAGQNLIKIKDILSKLKVNFMVSLKGINESVTTFSSRRFPFYTPLTSFFSKLNTFFTTPQKFVGRTKREAWEKNPIASIVSEVISKDLLDVTQPWIYIPSVGVFDALMVDQSVKILTKSIVRAHEFEDSTIDMTDPNIRTIIMYPQYIGVPIKIKDHVAIVSPTGLISDNKIIHVFEKIISQDKLSSLIPNFVSLNASKRHITFVIKTLECFDYDKSGLSKSNDKITINNVIITISAYSDMSIISVFFNFDKKTYSFQESIKKLSDNAQLLFKRFKDLPVTELYNHQLYNMIFNKSLEYWNVKDIDSANTTLDVIIKSIEETIDKTTVVQEPGALKRSLLLKQRDILKMPFPSTSEIPQIAIPQTKESQLITSPQEKREEIKKLESEVKSLKPQRSWIDLFKSYLVNPVNYLRKKINDVYRDYQIKKATKESPQYVKPR